MTNPYMGRPRPPAEPAVEPLDHDPVLGSALAARGPQAPPLSLPAGAPGLESTLVAGAEQPLLWLVGVHGGCGVSTVRSLFGAPDRVRESSVWPVPAETAETRRSRVVLVARTHARGVDALVRAAAQWAGGTFPGVDLVGTVLVADGPRPTKAQEGQLRRATSLTPATWHVGWQESWRALTADDPRPLPVRVRLTVAAITRKAAALRAAEQASPAEDTDTTGSTRKAG